MFEFGDEMGCVSYIADHISQHYITFVSYGGHLSFYFDQHVPYLWNVFVRHENMFDIKTR